MIDWREVEISDRNKINELLCASGCHNADYCFANLFMWRKEYNSLISFNDNRLLVGNPEWHMYAYPKGDGEFVPSVELLLEEAHSHGDKLMLRGLTDKTLDEFMPVYGDRFEISEDRENADYIYSIDKLANLPGRHLASKRNHINKFERNGKWEFRKVDSVDLHPAKEFVAKFFEEKDDPELKSEAVAMKEMFDHFDELEFMAGMLYQNDEAVAFTAGTRLDKETFDVHFEKALPDAEGAYTMINREFARLIASEYPEIEFINREEDMGLEGLRKAKFSYHPDLLLMKYYAREK